MEPAARLEQVVSVVVVGPHTLPRESLARALDAEPGFRVRGDYRSATDVPVSAPGCIVVAELPAAVGEAVEALVDAGARVIVTADVASIAAVEGALQAGAAAYVLKDLSVTELTDVVRRVAMGETVLHPEAASAVARRYAGGSEAGAALTTRQQEILRLLAQGLENKQIARRLGIGTQTVKTHVSRVLGKLNASSRTEAVVLAMRDGLVS